MSPARSFALAAGLGRATTFLLFGLIVLGAVVRTTGSGLACPDWPLCEGRWIPRDAMWRLAEQPTASFAYIRWMGERDLTRFDTVQRPQNVNLHGWRELLTALGERVADVYAYFSNYYEGYAPASANKLKRMLGQSIVDPADLEDQPSLF